MKKLIFLALITLFFVQSAVAQVSSAYVGDKNLSEAGKSIQLISSSITDFQKSKHDLERTRDRMLRNSTRYQKQLPKTDSLIDDYQKKISSLEDQKISFLGNTVGKGDQTLVQLKSRNTHEFANAYLLVSYANKLKTTKASAKSETGKDSENFKGIVVNLWYHPVNVRVEGPGEFVIEFPLAGNEKQEFDLPLPGDYRTTFIYGNECRQITKQIGPNKTYLYKTVNYDYMVTLPTGY